MFFCFVGGGFFASQMCLSLHRSGSGAGGLAHPGGEAAAAAELRPRQPGAGAGDQRALEETPGQDRSGHQPT